MWCYIKNENVDNFLNQYSQLEKYWNYLVLLQTKDACFLPRLFIKKFKSEYLIEYNGKTKAEYESISFKFNGELRNAQKKAAKVVEKLYKSNGFVNGILKLPPGTGKTVLTIYLANILGLKTCIVIDSDSLFKQWIREIMNFTDVTEHDVGVIKQKLFVTENKMFTVAMSGTLTSKLKRDLNKAFHDVNDSKFGLVVFDEVHATSSTAVYSRASLLFRTKNVLGLSATPFHYAEQEILMKNTIGEIIYESKDYEMTPEYRLIHYNSNLKKEMYVINKFTDYIQKKGFYNKIIIKSDKYVQLIKKCVQEAYNDGHNVIIVCMTHNQVKLISEHLNIIGIEHRRYYGQEKEIDKENDRVLVVTYSFCGKGFNMERLSALVLATSLSGKKSLIQVVGRILRSGEGKKKPIVYDFADMGFPMLTVPEVKRKKKIIAQEFPSCKIKEINNH